MKEKSVKTFEEVLICVCVVSALAISTQRSLFGKKPDDSVSDFQWYASIYSKKPSYIELFIDTRGFPSVFQNFTVESVQATCYGARGNLIEEKVFTSKEFGNQFSGLASGHIYQGFFRHRCPQAKSIRTGVMKFRYQAPPPPRFPIPFFTIEDSLPANPNLLTMSQEETILTRQTPQNWRGFLPLVSTRADLERPFGRPKKQPLPYLSAYDFPDESVRVVYSQGGCKPGIAGEWAVPRDTVLRIEVMPNEELYLEDIQMDVSKYKKIEDRHIAGRSIYIDEEKGISIETDLIDAENERVLRVKYGPRKNDESLRCK